MKENKKLKQLKMFVRRTIISIILSIISIFSNPITAQKNTVNTKSNWYDLKMMSDPILDQTLLFYLSMTYSQQSDVGECLETASRIVSNDPSAWTKEWVKTASRLDSLARKEEQEKNYISSGNLYLRSANYYSAALHRHNDPSDPKVKVYALAASTSFKKALKLLNLHAEAVKIPYENTYIPGYFFKTSKSKKPAPVLIVHQGRDGWAMHCKYIADAAINRGYDCLLIDGPGQGEMLRLQNKGFRYDWEKVITPVVDYLLALKDVDKSRIGLIGLSMGGLLAPRAAAFEHRLKICVANPGVINWGEMVTDFFNNFDPNLKSLWKEKPEAFNQKIAEMSAKIPLVDWGIKDMMWKHGVTKPSELMAQMLLYSNKEIISKITCKMLIMDGTDDDYSQGKELFNALNCPKDYMLFTADDTALQHCQVGAQAYSSSRLFDWIDKNL